LNGGKGEEGTPNLSFSKEEKGLLSYHRKGGRRGAESKKKKERRVTLQCADKGLKPPLSSREKRKREKNEEIMKERDTKEGLSCAPEEEATLEVFPGEGKGKEEKLEIS